MSKNFKSPPRRQTPPKNTRSGEEWQPTATLISKLDRVGFWSVNIESWVLSVSPSVSFDLNHATNHGVLKIVPCTIKEGVFDLCVADEGDDCSIVLNSYPISKIQTAVDAIYKIIKREGWRFDPWSFEPKDLDGEDEHIPGKDEGNLFDLMRDDSPPLSEEQLEERRRRIASIPKQVSDEWRREMWTQEMRNGYC